MNKDVSDLSIEELLEENALLREEVKASRRAADINNEMVVKQFVEVEEILQRLQEKAETERELRRKLADELSLAQERERQLAQAREAAEAAGLDLERRARHLQILVDVVHATASIMEVDTLIEQVVNWIYERFGLYHIGLFLVDETDKRAVLRACAGEASQAILARNYQLDINEKSMVGWSIVNALPRLAFDVREDAVYMGIPELPDTCSEVIVPLIARGHVIGVFSVQSNQPDAFDDLAITTLQTMADQIAIVIENAHLFEETQNAVAEAQELNRRLTRETWGSVGDKVETTGYVFTRMGTVPAPTDWLPTMGQAVEQKNLVRDVSDNNNNDSNETTTSVAIPLTLRDEVIGVIGIERPTNKPWSEVELTTIQAIAEQVALALDTARLARETERSAWRDRVVSESTAQVWSSAEVEEVMRATVAQLGDKLRASEVVIRLGTEIELARQE